MDTVPGHDHISPAAAIAVKLLRLAGITRRTDARTFVLLWAKPPRLSGEDVHDVLASFPPERREVCGPCSHGRHDLCFGPYRVGIACACDHEDTL